MSRGFREAARIGSAGWGRDAANHQLRAAARAAGSEPRLQLPGPGREPEPPEPPGAQASRARASLRARPADHERRVPREQPRLGERRAAPLSP